MYSYVVRQSGLYTNTARSKKARLLASLGDGDLFFLHGEKVFVEVIRDRRACIDAGTGDLSVLPTHETSPYFSLGDADSTRPG